jgi:hypothetical protein
MTMSNIWQIYLGILCCILIGWGCDEESTMCSDCDWDPGPGLITLSIGTDTLRFLPGDSASTHLTIIASDLNEIVMGGVSTQLHLSNPQLGFIEFLDPELRDTTNAQGRVNLLFTAIGTSGDIVFTATAGGISTSRTLAIRQQPTIISIFNFIQDTVDLDSEQDSVRLDLEATITYSDGTPVVNYRPLARLIISGGRLTPLVMSLTDSSGHSVGYFWWFTNDEFGEFEFCVESQYPDSTALDCIYIIDS